MVTAEGRTATEAIMTSPVVVPAGTLMVSPGTAGVRASITPKFSITPLPDSAQLLMLLAPAVVWAW